MKPDMGNSAGTGFGRSVVAGKRSRHKSGRGEHAVMIG